MALGQRLELRHSQTLVMTPQLRQAIQLLQFSNLDVAAFVAEEIERNPLLDVAGGDEGGAGAGEAGLGEAGLGEAGDAVGVEPAGPVELDGAGLNGTELNGTELDGAGEAEGWSYDPGADRGFGEGGGRSDFAVDARDIAETLAERPTLAEHLREQLLLFHDRTERLIGACLIALLDPAGRLPVRAAALAEAIGAPEAVVEQVRLRMQRFDPVGLFCHDLAECLAVQLAERNRLDPAMQALLGHLDLLARREMKALMALCGVDAEDMAEMVAELRALNPKPGAEFDTAPLQPLVPDVLMRKLADGDWGLELNPETLPRVLVNQGFFARVSARAAAADRPYLSERLQAAQWLVKSLEQRAETILKVAAEIVRRQDGFFRHGIAHLRPLIMREVAEAVGLHESTVSRVSANKYIATPRGTFELKFFFTASIAGTGGEAHSAEAVRHRIRALVGAETASNILSDDAIVAVLRREGVDIARRTVAKYREALHIPSSVQRKREKMALA